MTVKQFKELIDLYEPSRIGFMDVGSVYKSYYPIKCSVSELTDNSIVWAMHLTLFANDENNKSNVTAMSLSTSEIVNGISEMGGKDLNDYPICFVYNDLFLPVFSYAYYSNTIWLLSILEIPKEIDSDTFDLLKDLVEEEAEHKHELDSFVRDYTQLFASIFTFESMVKVNSEFK